MVQSPDRSFVDGRRFERRTGILTGGAKGIGRAAALRFLAEGGRLAVIDMEPEDGDFAVALRRDAGDGSSKALANESASHSRLNFRPKSSRCSGR